MSKIRTRCTRETRGICYNKNSKFSGEEAVKIRIALVDDRPDDLEKLREYVCRWAEERAVPLVPAPALFQSGEAFLEGFSSGRYDLVLLDIYMDGMSGMETAQKIREQDAACRLIFTTTTSDFAVDSYEVDASFYLVKPYAYEKLCRAMDRCGAGLLEQEQSVMMPDGRRLRLHQISYTEYQGRRVHITCADGERFSVPMRQADFAALLLPYPYFCDCMRGILVNFEQVDKLMEDRFLMKDGHTLPISRLKYREVREQFLNHLYRQVRGEGSECPASRS